MITPSRCAVAGTRAAILLGLGACLAGALAVPADAQRVRIPASFADSTAVALAVPELATALLEQYARRQPSRRADSVRTLDDRFRLEIVAGRYADAARSVVALRALRARATADDPLATAADVQYEIWANAMATSAATGRPFDASFAQAFRRAFARLDDHRASLVMRAMSLGPGGLQAAARQALGRARPGADVPAEEAMEMVRAYQRALTHQSFWPLVEQLFNAEDARRFVTERNVRVRTPDGATICALIMRPRAATRRLPTLFAFTVYVDSAANTTDVRRSVGNGYVGVVGYTRGKACSPEAPVPYQHDGRDAAAVIDWIATRPWSDGRVGMYGGSYNGFTAWATAKHRPRALRAIMAGAPAGPGLDVPMEGNIVQSFLFQWPLYTTNNKTLDNAINADNARWWNMNRAWYVSGRAYRDLPDIAGTPNPIFMEWLAHPGFDAYWRSMIPDGQDFARIDIPVLQTAGYYFGGPGAAMHYLTSHYAQKPDARHYLLIGPYDHLQAQRGVVGVLGDTTRTIAGYEIDPVARIDITADLRYQWFDWVLRGGPRPALLADRVNYQVMGQNVWKHAPSIAAMSNDALRLYLNAEVSGGRHRLTPSPGAAGSEVPLRIDLRYRGDIDSSFAGGGVRDTAINGYEATVFVSDPLEEVELSGLFAGHLEFVTNKKDVDLSVALFELTASGEYVQLPPFQIRASYARDPAVRHLLTPGERQTLDFRSIRLMSRKLERGSRIVAVIGPIKAPGMQINYGSGKDVSNETIADAGEPLEIRWLAGSYVELPIRR